MSNIQPGDVVMCLDIQKCVYGPEAHNPKIKWGDDLTGSVRRVVAWSPDEASGLGGWFDFDDGESWCDGCCRKIDKSDEGFATWMRSLRPAPAIGMPCLHEDALARLSPEGVAARAEGIAQNSAQNPSEGHPQ